MTQMGEQRCHQTARYLQDSPFSKEGVPRTQGPATSMSQERDRAWCPPNSRNKRADRYGGDGTPSLTG